MFGEPRSILHIDDSQDDLILLSRALAREAPSWTIQAAESMAEARLKLSAGGFDALILDLNLEDSQGIDTLIVLRREFPGLAIVVLTGMDYSDELSQDVFAHGGEAFLSKNFFDMASIAFPLVNAIRRREQSQCLLRLNEDQDNDLQILRQTLREHSLPPLVLERMSRIIGRNDAMLHTLRGQRLSDTAA